MASQSERFPALFLLPVCLSANADAGARQALTHFSQYAMAIE